MIYYFSFGREETPFINNWKTMRLLQPLGSYWQYFRYYRSLHSNYTITSYMREYK